MADATPTPTTHTATITLDPPGVAGTDVTVHLNPHRR
jgi:hypothetical protein